MTCLWLFRDSLLFADDVKIFSVISSEDDCLRIQEDLHMVDNWCQTNRMKLNIKKCQVITFHRCHFPVVFEYTVRGEPITRVQEVKDLGVILTPSLNPESHVTHICSRANRMLGFVFRFSRHFSDMKALKTLYCALVRQILEYASPVWDPHQKYLIEELESIQRRFIRMVGVRTGIPYRYVQIEDISRDLGLQSLASRRFSADIVLLHKILNGKVDCPDILRLILFKTPSATRSGDLFVRQYTRTNYAANSTMSRLQRSGNSIAEYVDFFHDSVATLRRRITGLQA